MKIFNAGRRIVACLVALGLAVSIVSVAAAAPVASGMQTPGGVRGDNGQHLRVTVKLNGKPLMNVVAAVAITAADGTAVVTGVTSKRGVYSTALDAGTYTVTATTTHYTATGSVTIVQSISPAMLTLDLTLKTPTN